MRVNKIPSFRASSIDSDKYFLNFNDTYKDETKKYLDKYTEENMTKGKVFVTLIPTAFRVEARYKANADFANTKRLDTFEVQNSLDTKYKNDNFIEQLNRKLKKAMPKNIFNNVETSEYYFDCFNAYFQRKPKNMDNEMVFKLKNAQYESYMPAMKITMLKNNDKSYNVKMEIEKKEDRPAYNAKLLLTSDGFICNPEKKKMNKRENEAAGYLKRFIRTF